ncbi:hypothetical protein Gpo141_00000151 [Globisporangium polare]
MGKRDRERERRRDAPSESESSDGGRSRHSRKDDRKKYKKAEKKPKKASHKKKSRHDRDEPPRPDYKKALVVVQELLGEFPELLRELVGLLQMLDDGEVAVISGIENRHIRSKLKELFPLLGLSKLSEPRGSFAKREQAKEGDASLLEVFQKMLTTGAASAERSNEADEEETKESSASGTSPPKSSSPVQVKRQAPIGPAMPPGGISSAYSGGNDDSDDDDEVVGPALPGMKGFRPADERVEVEMARRALELKQVEWDRARGVSSGSSTEEDKSAPLARQEWMTVMPESSFFKDSLAPANRPPGKPAAFRTKEPAAVDHTWFDAPAERDRARRAKLDMELLGYVREENAPTAALASSASRLAAAASQGGAGVNESIVPAANPEADDKMRRQMEQLRQSRGPSLLEQHQQRLADEAKAAGGGKAKPKAVWDRDRDLTASRGMSNDAATKIIEASKGINSKFIAPTISRQFL